MAENFDLIFGQSASSQYAWNDSDYQNGWETVGSTPPTAEQFDALQRRSDKKAQELNNALTPLVNQNTASNRQPLTTYALKDIRYSPLLPVGWYLECTTNGTTSSGDITLPTPLVENATITDGTCVWKVRKISSADGMPIGAIIAYSGNGNIPSGYLLCDGAAYSRTAFPDLFACIGTDYGSGDGSTTFNVPDANQAKRFLQGDVTAGQTKAAGLPDILGNTQLPTGSGNVIIGPSDGAMYGSNPASNMPTFSASSQTSTGNSVLQFKASRNNPIYGNSDTVQPPALTTRYIIKAFDGQTADSALIDITQYENELGNKADRSLSNLTDAGKSFSFPSNTWATITFDSSATYTEYTAPADGYAYMSAIPNNKTSSYIVIDTAGTGSSGVSGICYSPLTYGDMRVAIPVKKGTIIRFCGSIPFSTYLTNVVCRFVYAQGEVPA